MTRFVKNLERFVHSVVDEFILPKGWEEASEKDASPELLGKGDKVDAVNPQVIAPAAETPSLNVAPGSVSDRKLDVVDPSLPVTVFPEGKQETYPNGTDAVSLATPVGETGPADAPEPEAAK